LAHIVALKGLSNSRHKFVGVVITPIRQLNVINFLSIRSSPKVDVIFIEEHFGEVEEFWSDFSNI
jgi:hypothetical protein